MPLTILYAPEFKKDYKKLPSQTKTALKARGELFQLNPFHPLLRSHKLSGRLKGCWAFSVDFRIRVMFEFIAPQTVMLLRVGDHSIYRNSR